MLTEAAECYPGKPVNKAAAVLSVSEQHILPTAIQILDSLWCSGYLT